MGSTLNIVGDFGDIKQDLVRIIAEFAYRNQGKEENKIKVSEQDNGTIVVRAATGKLLLSLLANELDSTVNEGAYKQSTFSEMKKGVLALQEHCQEERFCFLEAEKGYNIVIELKREIGDTQNIEVWSSYFEEFAFEAGKKLTQLRNSLKDSPEEAAAASSEDTIYYQKQQETEPFISIPTSYAIGFFGRDKELEQLHSNLMSLPTHKVLGVVGEGGQGKTELCLEYAKRHKQFYKGGVCWINARNSNVAEQILIFAKNAGYLIDRKLESPEEKLDVVWNVWRKEKTLFIYDDVFARPDFEKLHLPPDDERFTVLLTTRDRDISQKVQYYDLNRINSEHAFEFLETYVQDGRMDKEHGMNLIEFADGLPLGIELIGGHLRSNETTTLEYLYRFLCEKREDWDVLDTEVFNSVDGPLRTNQRNIRECYDMSWLQLDFPEQQIAIFVAAKSNTGFSEREVKETIFNTSKRLNSKKNSIKLQVATLRKLARYCLIRSKVRNHSYDYSYHLLLRDFIRMQVPPRIRERLKTLYRNY